MPACLRAPFACTFLPRLSPLLPSVAWCHFYVHIIHLPIFERAHRAPSNGNNGSGGGGGGNFFLLNLFNNHHTQSDSQNCHLSHAHNKIHITCDIFIEIEFCRVVFCPFRFLSFTRSFRCVRSRFGGGVCVCVCRTCGSCAYSLSINIHGYRCVCHVRLP